MREVRQAEIDKRKKRRRGFKRALGALVVVGLVVLVVALVSQKSPTKPKSTSTTTTTAAPATAVAPTCPAANGSSKRETEFTAAPKICINEKATYLATVKTDVGTFVLSLPAPQSPAAVNSFVFLARYHYYDGLTFFRVIPNNILQGGSNTNSTLANSLSPGYYFTGNLPPASCSKNDSCYPIGSIDMANSDGPETNASQFFIVAGAAGTTYPRDYTRFGTVTSGMSVVDAIARDGNASASANGSPPKVTHHIISVTIKEASS
jgi:peptidyl-prolyl cis-trans isomerase B (cyclophilin B)